MICDNSVALPTAPALGAAPPSRAPTRFPWVGIVLAACLAALPFWPGDALADHAPPGDFVELSARLLPTVVNVAARSKGIEPRHEAPDTSQAPPGSPFEEFFKDFMERNGQGEPQQHRGLSVGSGFVIDAEKGYIVTNNHVIEGADGQPADEIKVTLQNEKSYLASIVGRDPAADVAVLKIQPSSDLVAVTWGDSNQAKVGEWVLAIGSPFTLTGTVSAGIISARNRDIHVGRYDDFIQTDASINKGNSGGPLFNMKGEVIGINTLIYSPSGGSIGLGFATPSAEVRPVVTQLIQFGKARRGWLGVSIQSVDQDIADSLGLKNARGALVSSVKPKSPAAVGGIQANDVILSFDGKEVGDSKRLPRIVAETAVDRDVDVKLWRDGKEVTKTVRIGEMPDQQTVASAEEPGANGKENAPPKGGESVDQLGLSLAPITAESRQRYQLGDDIAGVLVTSVKPDSPAADKQLIPGDVLVEVNQQEVKSPKDVIDKVEQARKENKKSVLLLVQRQGSDVGFVALPLNQKSKG